jgi:D-alanine-D-alanine ligase
LKNFDKEKYEVIPMVMETQSLDLSKVKEIAPEVVFISLHGGVGEDGTIQKIFEDEGIKFIGCGSEASQIGMDKIKFLELVEKNGIPVPKGLNVIKGEMVDLDLVKELGDKWVVKPAGQGSSVGVTIIDNLDKLDEALEESFKYEERAIIEEFLPGMEVSCGILGNPSAGSGQVVALPVIEICPKNNFFDYEAKYTEGKCEEIVPARLSEETTKKVQEYALKVFELVEARGFIRVDFVIKDENPIILEMNTIPGLTPNSLLPKEAKAAGIEYAQLLDKMIELALN